MSGSRKRPRASPPQALSPNSQGAVNLRELVKSFDEEGYAVMSLDAVRNTAFAKAIHYCVQAGGQHTWLEIGAGADALLTRYVLRSGAVGMGRLSSISTSSAAESTKLVLTRTRVCAVEGGAPAAASAERKLAPFRAERAKAAPLKLRYEGGVKEARISAPVALQSAWAVVQGVSSEASAARSVRAVAAAWRLPADRFPALVHELLGFFASSEWAVQGDDPVWRIAEHSSNAFNFYNGPCGTQVQMRRVPLEDLAVLREPRIVWRSELFGSPYSAASPAPPAEVPSVGAGCLELLAFGDPAVLRVETRSREWRNPPSAAPSRCNALAFWLWIQAGPVPQHSNRCFTSPGATLFPYGCPDADVRACRPLNAPVLSSCMLDFGSGAFSSGWRNFVLFFAGPPAVVAARAAEDASSESDSDGAGERACLPPLVLPAGDVTDAGEALPSVPERAVPDAGTVPALDAAPCDALSVASSRAGPGPDLATPAAPPASARSAAKRPRSRAGVERHRAAESEAGAADAAADSGTIIPPGGSLRVDTRVHVAPGRAPWYHVVVRVMPPPAVEVSAEKAAEAEHAPVLDPPPCPPEGEPSPAADAAAAPMVGGASEPCDRAATPAQGAVAAAALPESLTAVAANHAEAAPPLPRPLHVFSCVIDTSGREGEDALVRAFCAELGIEQPRP